MKPGYCGQTGPKFTDTEREGLYAQVAEMDRRGYTQWQIVQKLADKGVNLSQSSISDYLKRIRAEYRDHRFASIDNNREEKRQQYADIRTKAWEMYEKLAEGSEMEIIEERSPPQMSKGLPLRKGEPAPKTHEQLEVVLRRTIIKSSSKRVACAQFLAIIMKCLDAEREMDGLVAPKIAFVPAQATLDWDSLIRRAPIQAIGNDYQGGAGGIVQSELVDGASDDPITSPQEKGSAQPGAPTNGTDMYDEMQRRILDLEREASSVVPPPPPPEENSTQTNGDGNGSHH